MTWSALLCGVAGGVLFRVLWALGKRLHRHFAKWNEKDLPRWRRRDY